MGCSILKRMEHDKKTQFSKPQTVGSNAVSLLYEATSALRTTVMTPLWGSKNLSQGSHIRYPAYQRFKLRFINGSKSTVMK